MLINDDAMNDVDTNFNDEVEEQPTSLVQELLLIKDCAVQLATLARGSLFPDKVAGTCILQVSKADRKSTRLNSSHVSQSRMPSSA